MITVWTKIPQNSSHLPETCRNGGGDRRPIFLRLGTNPGRFRGRSGVGWEYQNSLKTWNYRHYQGLETKNLQESPLKVIITPWWRRTLNNVNYSVLEGERLTVFHDCRPWLFGGNLPSTLDLSPPEILESKLMSKIQTKTPKPYEIHVPIPDLLFSGFVFSEDIC